MAENYKAIYRLVLKLREVEDIHNFTLHKIVVSEEYNFPKLKESLDFLSKILGFSNEIVDKFMLSGSKQISLFHRNDGGCKVW